MHLFFSPLRTYLHGYVQNFKIAYFEFMLCNFERRTYLGSSSTFIFDEKCGWYGNIDCCCYYFYFILSPHFLSDKDKKGTDVICTYFF